jgi:DMSO/TMAO reductase YedYZ molybdopterin-dependent catalytic subunit
MTSDGFVESGRSIGRRSFLTLAALGLLGLVDGCSNNASTSLSLSRPPIIYSISNFGPRPKVLKGFTLYSTGPAEVDLKSWRLQVDGLVDKPMKWNLEQVLKITPVTLTSDFQCGDGWLVRLVRWQGIRLNDLLSGVAVRPEAKSLLFHTMDGSYTSALSLESAQRPDVLLAYAANDAPLAKEQGFPLRLVVPGMFGYRSAKWVNRIELSALEHRDLFENSGTDLAIPAR